MSGPTSSTTILGTLMLQPNFLDTPELDEALFLSDREKRIFRIIGEIWEDRRPAEIDPVILAERLGGDGAATYVGKLTQGLHHLSRETFVDHVHEIKSLRLSEKIIRVAERIGREHITTKILDPAGMEEIRSLFDERNRLETAAFDPDKVLMTGAEMQTLDIHVDWTVDKLIPERGLTLIYGPGGVGKTWLCLAIAQAVAKGEPFLGLPTKQKPVFYIDRENPWPILIERVRKMDIRAIRFWHFCFTTPPPKLDAPDWEKYKALPTGSLIFFDTCRACHDGEENSSMDAALVMGRLKELRELNNDIALLHHTPRSSERTSKGSTAWEDLADHVLAFHRVRRGSLKEIKEEIDAAEYDPAALYHLGTGKKTRYAPIKFYITANYETGEFSLAEDPGAKEINTLAEYIAGPGYGQNQTEIIAWAKESLEGGRREKFVSLLQRGERQGRWRSRKVQGTRGIKRIYEPTN